MTGALSGKHAIVTGGGRGIGLALAAALAGAGATVGILGRDRDTLVRAAEGIGPACHWERADVTDETALLAAMERLGPPDILVNNAGGAETAPFKRTGTDLLARMLALNLAPVAVAARWALPGMLDKGWGRIVTIASTAGLKGYPYVSAYCAAKHAAVGLTRALALEVAGSGVTANALCPGYTETDLLAGSLTAIRARTGLDEGAARARLLSSMPLGRAIRPEEVAAALLWLCGPGSDAVTGQAIPIAGGEVG